MHRYDPIRTIEWVVSILTLIGGVYLFSPAYEAAVVAHGPGPLTLILTHPVMLAIWGGILLLGALCVMFGLWRSSPRVRSAGWFMVWLARLFQVLGQILTIGFLPLTWIYPFTIACVVLVLWAVARTEVKAYASP